MRDPETEWMRQAACNGLTAWFFIDDPRELESVGRPPRVDYDIARPICLACPVKDECLAFALANHRACASGMWGGLDERERQKIHERTRVRRKPRAASEENDT